MAPCVLLNVALVWSEVVGPLWVGCVTIVAYWQMLYGTLIYFLLFVVNWRYVGFDPVSIWFFVMVTNEVWIVFPGMEIYAAVCILRNGNMDLFRG